jgi:AcrR family transcriptional regulator
VSKRRKLSTTGKEIRQERGWKTYDALIATGFKLLEQHEFDQITVADLAKAAGYSVGAFYARFRSKEEFFDALVAHHLEQRAKARDHLLRTLPDDELIRGIVSDLVSYYWKRRWFWRAELIRSIRDPKPLRKNADQFSSALVDRISERRGRPLSPEQESHVRSAFQITLGTINNAVIYEAGPILVGQKQFVDDLVRTFLLVSDYENLLK